MAVYRYNHGPVAKSVANQAACRPNLPGLKRHTYDPRGGKKLRQCNGEVGKCPILTKKGILF
jgi:hypothetical protein